MGESLNDVARWLNQRLGSEHSAKGMGVNAIGVYFRRIEDAEAFVAAFPDLELSDQVKP